MAAPLFVGGGRRRVLRLFCRMVRVCIVCVFASCMWMVQRFRLSRLEEGVYFLTTLIYLLSLLTGGAYTPLVLYTCGTSILRTVCEYPPVLYTQTSFIGCDE